MNMNRNYKLSDDELIQHSYTVLEHLKEDLPDFTLLDPDLDETKRDELATLVEEALREGGDEANKSGLGQRTEKLLSEIATARWMFNQLRYWVVKTFPNSKAIQRQFGIGRYTRVAKSQARLIGFFFELGETIKQYQEQLKAAGTPGDLLEQVVSQADVLKTAEAEQESYKGARMVDTVERVERLNAIYEILRAFNAAAEFVYYEQPVKRDQYRTPVGGQTVEEEASMEV